MHTLDLAYVGRGLHEELIAHIADQEDYFADEGVHVAIRDGTGWDIERLRHGAMIGLGRALLSRLTDGIPWVALVVNTHHPLFWFLARPELTSLADVAGRRLAVHPPHTPPGCFARIVLRRHGLDPDRDVETLVRPPGDYSADLRRLRAGTIAAALVGSTLAPEQIAAEEGLHVLAWVGEHFQIPTVGVAVDPSHVPPDHPAVAGLVRATRRALHLLHTQPERAVQHLHPFLGRLTDTEARQHYERYLVPHFTTNGHVNLNLAQNAIPTIAAELGISTFPAAGEVYRTDPATIGCQRG